MGSLRRHQCLHAMIVVAALLVPTVARTEGKWASLAPLPRALTEIVGVAAGGKLYVMAGLLQGSPVGAVYEYDRAADRWIEKKPMPVPAHHVMATEHEGKIYVFGGFVRPRNGEGWLPIDNAWAYDPASDSWQTLAPLPTRRGAGVAVTVAGKIYVIGGANVSGEVDAPISTTQSNDASVGTMEEYDPTTERWQARTAMPTARNHLAAGAVNGKIYAIGGRLGSALITRSSNTDVVEEYDPARDRWALKAPMPTARSGSAGGVYGGKIYVAGGEYQNEAVMMAFRALEAYDPVTNGWERLPRMPSPRHGLAAAMLGSTLHVAGGDFQSAGVPGVESHLASHDAFEIGH